jgi:hypothetical protein
MNIFKLISSCILIFYSTSLIGQEIISKKENSKLDFKPYFSIGISVPIQFGNTALAKGHGSGVGFAAELGVLTYQKFYVGLGTDSNAYNVTNQAIIGNYPISKHNSYYGFLSYEFNVIDKFSLSPSIGFGSSELVIKKSGKRRGEQDGNEFRIGTSINYNFNTLNALALKVNYINNVYDVNTNEEFQDFFSKSNQIQIAIVYKFM